MNDDLYALLRVQLDADARDIKKAYFGLLRQYPPETHPEEFQKIRAAYDTLSNPEARKAYDLSRSKAAQAGLREELAAIMRGAIEAMEAREFDRAVPLLLGVVNERPDAEEARGRLCACLLNLDRFQEALEQARKFEEHHSALSLAVLFRAYALRGLNRDMEARAAFVRAGELDPLDFRPVRGVVDLDFKRNAAEDALVYLDQRLANAAESIRVPLQFERISTLFATSKTEKANEALARLEAAATTPELQEELQWFYEREAAGLFARRQAPAADQLLERLRKRVPTRPSVWATKERVLPLSALPDSAVKWLEAQSKNAEFLCVPNGTASFRIFLFLIFGTLSATTFALAFSSSTGWKPEEFVTLCVLLPTLLAVAVWAFTAWRASWNHRLPNMTVLHRMAFIEVEDDKLRITPLVRLSRSNATHHHSNVGYTHTGFSLAFGDRWIQFSVAGHERAERLATTLGELRMRMLDLLHSGLLGGEEGIEFFPTTDASTTTARRNWRPPAFAALVGLALTLIAGFGAGRSARTASLAEAMGTSDAATLRAFLKNHADDREFAEAARLNLKQRRAEVASRLAFSAPHLADAFLAAPADALFKVQVLYDGEVDQQALASTQFTFVQQSISESATKAREEALISTLQKRIDALVGVGWIVISRQPGVELHVDYRLTLGTARYFFRGGKSRDTAWAEPVFVTTLGFLGDKREERRAPHARVWISGDLSDSIARGNSMHGTASLMDSAWAAVIEDAAALVGVRD